MERVKLSRLKANPANPRIIKDDKFHRLVDSILEFPKMLELRPVVTDVDMTVLGGNMRLRALQHIAKMTEAELRGRLERLGRTDALDYWLAWQDVKDVPAVRACDLTDAEKRQFVIKDNASFGQWDWDALANEWDEGDLTAWGVDLPTGWNDTVTEDDGGNDDDEIERKRREFEERMKAGEISEEDEEYQEFLAKFELKKTTDDCYTPPLVYDAVADWVAKEYGLSKAKFVRPFYPNGDYQKENYPDGSVVVDNPPFSIMSEILKWYEANGIKFFLFGPHLTLFGCSFNGCALPVGVVVTYENGANVTTSFVTNLEPNDIRIRSCPTLYDAVKKANDANLKEMRRELPKYSYPPNLITVPLVASFSKFGIPFVVKKNESQIVSALDSQKESGKTIFGRAYLVGNQVVAEREKAEREKAEREKAEREKAERWELSERELAIVAKLTENAKEDGNGRN